MNNNATLKITTLIVILLLFFKKDKKESLPIFDEDGEFEFPKSPAQEFHPIDQIEDLPIEPINVEEIERLTDKNNFIIEDSVKEDFNQSLGIITGGLKPSPAKIVSIKKDLIDNDVFVNTKSIYEVVNPFIPTIEPIKPNYSNLNQLR
jgi:hypothetical protein